MDTKPTIKNFIVIILPAILTVFIIFFLIMPKVKENRKDLEENNKKETFTKITQEEAVKIAVNSKECSNTGILTDKIIYNEVTKTWWIDLERMPELEKDGCNPACVVFEETKTTEVNWRCTGLKQQ